MQSDLPWDDLKLFAAVARGGSLSAAAARTGRSVATLSRRMTALEERLSGRLFLHGASGYRLTAQGRALLEKTQAMERAAADIAAWQATKTGPQRVRISAGTWTARMLARNLDQFWTREADWVPEFVWSDRDLDLARREIDIGIRNRRPTQSWLAGRKTATVGFAAYARSAEVTGWISASEEAATTPSARWVHAQHGGDLVTTVNDPRLALELARKGLGRVVLPMFVGEAEPDLMRLSDPIAALEGEEWLVSHQDARHEPAVRRALDALAGFLTRRREGVSAQGPASG